MVVALANDAVSTGPSVWWWCPQTHSKASVHLNTNRDLDVLVVNSTQNIIITFYLIMFSCD